MSLDEMWLAVMGFGLIFFGSFSGVWLANAVGVVLLTIVGSFLMLRWKHR
jgi:hypothetical protein